MLHALVQEENFCSSNFQFGNYDLRTTKSKILDTTNFCAAYLRVTEDKSWCRRALLGRQKWSQPGAKLRIHLQSTIELFSHSN